jgi:hypothetical protein
MQLLGLGDFFSDLVITLFKISVQPIVFIIKTVIKGLIRSLFDSFRFIEILLKRIEHLFKR